MAESVVTVVLEQLTTILHQEVELILDVRIDIKSLTATLNLIKAVLEDAEQKQIRMNAAKIWLEDLKHVLYDADDVLDEWFTRKVISRSPTRGVSGVRKKVLSNLFSCFGPIVVRYKISHRIKAIRERLDQVARDKDQLNLIQNLSHSDYHPRRLTSSIVDVEDIRGRDLDKQILLGRLLGESSSPVDIQPPVTVISIVGTAGFGKTALAQLILSEETVMRNFELKMWVCVSDPFDLPRIAKEITEQALKGKVSNDIGWESLHQCLSDAIKGKRFLLVLDDFWSEDYEDWSPIKVSLDGGAEGSRIIVTTRNERVAKMMCSTYTHRLGQLSEDACWSLFQHIAFWGRSQEEVKQLEEIGRELAKKCIGVPLAAKTLASLMRFKQSKNDWRNVLASDIWEMQQDEKGFFPALLLSYHALPSHLRQCLMYTSIFPKDEEMQKDKLVKLWMAQGFLGSEGNRDLELIGGDYFEQLSMRSFFQDFQKDRGGNIIICKMHDLVHDFVQYLTRNEVAVLYKKGISLSTDKVRHINACGIVCPLIYKSYSVRTLLRASRPTSLDLFRQLACLRALDLSGCDLGEVLPKEVGWLLHLRYLDLSRTTLRELHEALCNLLNLQTLKLSYCFLLSKLPEGIGRLTNLRHIELEKNDELTYVPQSIGRLTNLHTLSSFIVSGARERRRSRIRELRNLNYLTGHLTIKGIRQVENENESKGALMLLKKSLHSLCLDCGYSVWEDVAEDDVKRMVGVVEGLQPHNNLEILELTNYPGWKLPVWMSNDSMLSNILSFSLDSCSQITCLPAFGTLRTLETLSIRNLLSVKCIASEFWGILSDDAEPVRQILFPRLKNLCFFQMLELEEWHFPDPMKYDNADIMPCLHELEIKGCPKLKTLPEALGKLQSLQRLELMNLNVVKKLLGRPAGNEESTLAFTSSEVLFPKLEYLRLLRLREWEGGEEEIDERSGILGTISVMPRLQTLCIQSCRKLRAIPQYLFSQSLRRLTIAHSEQLSDMQPCLPLLLEKLAFLGDVGVLSRSLMPVLHDNRNSYPNLKLVMIYDSPDSTPSLPDGIQKLTSLEHLQMSGCQFPNFRPEELTQLLMLRKLVIHKCPTVSERCTEKQSTISYSLQIINGFPINNMQLMIG